MPATPSSLLHSSNPRSTRQPVKVDGLGCRNSQTKTRLQVPFAVLRMLRDPSFPQGRRAHPLARFLLIFIFIERYYKVDGTNIHNQASKLSIQISGK